MNNYGTDIIKKINSRQYTESHVHIQDIMLQCNKINKHTEAHVHIQDIILQCNK